MFDSLISTSELVELLNNENVVIIDCRFNSADKEAGRKAYQEAHIVQAQYAHLDEDLSGEIIAGKTGRHPIPDVLALSKSLSAWGIDESKQVVVYDDKSGAIASRLWWLLRWLGHEQVAVLDGGWSAWQAQDLPISNELFTPEATKFKAHPNHQLWVSANYVSAIVNNKKYKIVDSRAAIRYRGEEEPLDPIAGHIPSAISAPFAENIGEDEKLLSKEKLRERFAEILNDTPIEQTIFYCGSGVTACHNLLAMHHAGMGDAKLYVGSWSDWITDEDREVVKEI